MAAPARWGRTRSGYVRVRVRVDAMLAWGIDLHTGPAGQVHESIVGRDLIEPFETRLATQATADLETFRTWLDAPAGGPAA